MRPTFVCLFWLLACSIKALCATKHGYQLKDSHAVPPQWKQLHRAPPDHTITLRIGLKQDSFEELERRLYEVSDPDHKLYGHHLSEREIHALIAPSDDALFEVPQWLQDHNVELNDIEYSPAKDWLSFPLSVSKIEALLDTRYHVYENHEGTRLVRTSRYSLPAGMHRHIDVIQPTNYFGDPTALRKPFKMSSDEQPRYYEESLAHSPWHGSPTRNKFSIRQICNESAVSNQCLRTLYKTIDYVPKAPEENRVAMTAFLHETANITDFHIFLADQRQDADHQYTYNYTTINGGPDNQHAVPKRLLGFLDVEANLDSQTIGGFVYPTQMTVYSTAGKPSFMRDRSTPTDSNEPYLTWLAYVTSLENPPHTISTSYGDDEQTVPYSYAKRVCEEFAQLGARGVSLFFAAGDDGVGPNGTCVSNDGEKRHMFLPEFPTSCPYITSVGATRSFSPEIVAWDSRNGYVSGSGISNYFPRPKYQDKVVDQYLHSIGDLHAGLYNKSGRAYPDIAAQGFKYLIVYAGKNRTVDGTSASTPCAASIFTLVNDALMAAGKRPMGFLNPLLYKRLYKAFNDVTIGSTWGCNTTGFSAKRGWDLASGWGTPDFLKIKKLLLERT